MTDAADRKRFVRASAIASLAAELALFGCSRPVERAEPVRAVAKHPVASVAPSIFPENALPAAYVASIDKGEGRSEHWTVWLKPGIYFMRVEFREKSGSTSEDWIGTWDTVRDRAAIRLRVAGRNPIEFEVPSLDTLRFRGIIVRHATDPPSDLVRNGAVKYLEPRVSLTGYLSWLDDDGYFQDCGTAWRLPIRMDGDFARARRRYRDATQVRRSAQLDSALAKQARSLRSTMRVRPISTLDSELPAAALLRPTTAPPRLLVSLEGRIVQRPGIDGAMREWLIIERFGQAMPGKACGVSSTLAEQERQERLASLPYGLR
jgi:hypothetical protein